VVQAINQELIQPKKLMDMTFSEVRSPIPNPTCYMFTLLIVLFHGLQQTLLSNSSKMVKLFKLTPTMTTIHKIPKIKSGLSVVLMKIYR